MLLLISFEANYLSPGSVGFPAPPFVLLHEKALLRETKYQL